MKRPTPLFLSIVALAAGILLTTCSLGLPTATPTKKFLIVDRSSGRLLSSYELVPGTKRPVRIVSYGADRKIQKTFELTYDDPGRLSRNLITINVPAGAPIKDETTYTYSDVKDAAGRLVTTEQFSSKGEKVEIYYGYDASGEARGVVQKSDHSLVMKDYLQ